MITVVVFHNVTEVLCTVLARELVKHVQVAGTEQALVTSIEY